MPSITTSLSGGNDNGFSRKLSTTGIEGGLDSGQREELTRGLFNSVYSENRGMGFMAKTASYAASSVIDLADSLVAAPIIPGTDRGDIWGLYKDYGPFGNELENFYQRNQSAVEAISGIAGAVGTGYVAGALVLPRITNAMASSTAINSSALWQWGGRANAAVRARLFDAQAQAAANGQTLSAFNSAKMAFYGHKAGRMAGVAAFEEVAIAGIMGSNKMVWSDEMSENLFFGALGIGIGGALGGIAARAEYRKIANSSQITKARADAIDPQGATFLHERFEGDAQLIARSLKASPAKESTTLTAMLVEARQNAPAGMSEAGVANLDRYRIQRAEQAIGKFQQIGAKGITGVTGTKIQIKGEVHAQYTAATAADPFVFNGLDSIGTVSRQSTAELRPIEIPDAASSDRVINQARLDFDSGLTSKPDVIAARAKVIEKKVGPEGFNKYQSELSRLKKKVDNLAKERAAAKQQQTPLEAALFARRQYIKRLRATEKESDIREAMRLEKQQETVLINGSIMPAGKEAAELSTYQAGQVKLTQPFKGQGIYQFETSLGLPIRIDETFGVKNYHALSLSERMEVIEAMNQVFAQYMKSGATHIVSSKPDWFQLDAAIHFEKQGGKVDWSKSGFKDKEAGELESLKRKAVYLADKGAGGYWDRVRFNLPLPSAVERIEDPSGDMLAAVLKAAAEGADYASVKALRGKLNEVAAYDVKGANDNLSGNLFTFNRTEKGEWMDPLLAFFDESPGIKLLDDAALAEQMAEQKAARFASLVSNPDKPGMIPALSQATIRHPSFEPSLSVRQLADDQVTGLGGFTSQAVGELVTREFKNRDNPTLLSLQEIRQFINRESDKHLSELVRVNLGDSVAKLNAAPAAGSKVLVNQFLSNSHGWDLLPDMVQVDKGKWGFVLEDSAKNRARLGVDKIEEGDLLVNPRTGAPIVLDELGMDFVSGFQRIATSILEDTNRVRRSMGLEPIRQRDWYAPPPDTTGKFVGFTFDEFNKLVPGGGIVAETQAEYTATAARMTKEFEGKGWTIRSRKDVEQVGDLWDEALADWLSPTSAVAPVRGSTGALASQYVNPNAVQDTLNWVKRQVERNGSGVMRSLYDSQLGIVRARSAMQDALSGKESGNLRNIFDEYEGLVLGSNLGDSKKSISGAVMRPIEGLINAGLESAWPAMRFLSPAQLGKWVGDLEQLTGFNGSRAKNFKQLANQLEDYTPFKNAQDYIDQTLKIVRPPEVREISQKLNALSASMILRWFEIPHAAMNLIGIITTMPSILRNGRAPITTFVGQGEGKIGVVDTYRILAASTTDMLKDARKADWEYMKLNGDASQQVADFNVQMASIKDKGSFMRILTGAGSKGGSTGVTGLFKEKGIDGLLGAVTDSSENYSRSWAHFAGLRLADMQGIVGMEARHSFAREIANAAIANYNPLNRPELYQSAFGSLFGLFMSWMQSYNQRLFRWMENKDYAAVGRQLAMQSSLFGLTSNPGYNQVESILLAAGVGETEDGREATLMDHIYAKFGPQLGSALAHGGLHELGLVLYPRGDMNYRDVTIDPSRLMAGAGVAQSFIQGLYESISALTSGNSLDASSQLAEIAARHMPNRSLKGALEVLMNEGRAVDSAGRTVSETRDAMESMLRILGLRSTRQQAEVEAFFANRQQQQREAARQETFRLSTRSLLRGGKLEQKLPEIFAKYNELGMRPENFRTWLKNQIREAEGTRGINELQKALKNPATQQSVWRYNAYGAIQ